MMSLGTDFETHAKWQGSIEKPAAEGFVAKKVHTIKSNKVQRTHWNANKCKECLGNCPEAVVRQATISPYSQVWKSLGDSLPKLDCNDLAEAYVTRESAGSRILSEKERYDSRLPNRCSHEKPLAKGGAGKENQYYFLFLYLPGSHEHLALRKCIMCARNMGAHVQRGTRKTKGINKWDEKLDSHAAEKGPEKLVSSNCTKILDKESSD
jgi:hypothetical protein